MRVKDLIEYLQKEDPELRVELAKLLAVRREPDGTPLVITLDFPIIGTANNRDGDLYLIIEAAPEMIAFGKDIRRFDGTPVKEGDMG